MMSDAVSMTLIICITITFITFFSYKNTDFDDDDEK